MNAAPHSIRTNDLASEPGNFRRIYADLRELEYALVDANIKTAREAFARLLQDLPHWDALIKADSCPTENPRRIWLRLLAHALDEGEIENARQFLVSFQEVAANDSLQPFLTARISSDFGMATKCER